MGKRDWTSSRHKSAFLDVFELFLLHPLDLGSVFDGNDHFAFLLVFPLLLPFLLLSFLQNFHHLLLLLF